MKPETVIIVSRVSRADRLLARSRLKPSVLFIACCDRLMARRGVVVEMPALAQRVLTMLIVADGCPVAVAEIIAVAYGDDPRGGPEFAEVSIRKAILEARAAGAALGVAVTTAALGYSARIVEAA